MKLFVTLATIVGFATAACPNSCSGHGKCNHYDACTCFKETPLAPSDFKGSIEVEWTGADCSRRTCPRGISWAKSSLESDVTTNVHYVNWKRTMSAADKTITLASPVAVTFTWTGKHSVLIFNDKAAYDSCDKDKATEITNKGSGKNGSPVTFTTSATGIFYFGCGVDKHCEDDDQKTMLTITAEPVIGADTHLRCRHQSERECSDQGLCDRATGLCSCFPGYTGSSCQRTGCPDDCSGHGSCRSNRDFAYDWAVAKTTQMLDIGAKDQTEEFKETYTASYDDAWDSDMHWGCLCDKGYRGPSCALVECPSTNDPLDDKCPEAASPVITDYQLQHDAPFGGDGWEAAYSLETGESGEQKDLANSDFNKNYILDKNGRKVYGCYGAMSGQDCSGRGICDYSTGTCNCFSGYVGTACEAVEELS